VDALKIDRSFVDGLGGDPEDEAIVALVVSLARALGLSVVAEGVETPQQRERMRGLGCDAIQGYCIGRPMSPDEAWAAVRAERLDVVSGVSPRAAR
jgi:diguanylate cyclase